MASCVEKPRERPVSVTEKVPQIPDGEGRPYSISDGINRVVTSTVYNYFGLPTTITFGTGLTDSYQYDPNTGRMTSFGSTVAGGGPYSGSLAWNPNGTLYSLTIQDPFNSADAQTCTYEYMRWFRLHQVTCGSIWNQTMSYDPFSNISISESVPFLPTYNLATNWYATIPSGTLGYDNNGDLTSDGFHTYQWDADGNLGVLDSGGSTQFTNSYDALGRRVEQVSASGAPPKGEGGALLKPSSSYPPIRLMPFKSVSTLPANDGRLSWPRANLAQENFSNSPSTSPAVSSTAGSFCPPGGGRTFLRGCNVRNRCNQLTISNIHLPAVKAEVIVLDVAIYARVSTTDQSCEMQLRELREYAGRRGWSVKAEYIDTGWSGAKANRPKLDRLMRDASRRQFDVVLVYKLDRFGRSVRNCLDGISALRSHGVRFLAVSQNIDTDDANPTSRLMLHILAAVAEFERELIRERVASGVANARRQGKRLGRPRRVFDRARAQELRRQGMSFPGIARELGVGYGTIVRALRAES